MDSYSGLPAVAAVGIGATPLYRRGTSPDSEMRLCLKAIVSAAEDAGLDVSDIDGFVSYGAEANAGPRLVGALGTKELRWSSLVWGGGGGGTGAAVAIAVAAIQSGQAEIVVVYRSSAEQNSGRLGPAVGHGFYNLNYTAHGVDSSTQIVALRMNRALELGEVLPSSVEAFVAASNYHARNNPDAAAYNRELTVEEHRTSRWIVEPFRLFDCSRENDGAAAIILTRSDRAKDLRQQPAYVLSASQGAHYRNGELDENQSQLTSVGFTTVAPRLYAQAHLTPSDVDVAQIYTNFSVAGVVSILEHGLCAPEEQASALVFENLIAPSGRIPINTSGGDLGEGFIQGMNCGLEAIRQIRGTSTNQVPDASVSLWTGGPSAVLVGSVLFGPEDALN